MAFVSFYKQPNDIFASFYKAFIQLLKNLAPIPFAQVDVEQNRNLSSKYNATNANTTLIWFTKGNPEPYTGISLQTDDIVFWVVNEIDTFTTTLTMQVICLCNPAAFVFDAICFFAR